MGPCPRVIPRGAAIAARGTFAPRAFCAKTCFARLFLSFLFLLFVFRQNIIFAMF